MAKRKIDYESAAIDFLDAMRMYGNPSVPGNMALREVESLLRKFARRVNPDIKRADQ